MSETDAERTGFDRVFDSDVAMIAGTFLALYGAYLVLGLLAGLSGRGILATLVQLTLLVLIYAMVTLSLNLHWGYTGLFNIGIAGFLAVGAYTTLMVSKPAATGAGSLISGLGMPLVVGLAAATVTAALLGLLIALPALRLRADYLAIVTIAMSEIVRFTFTFDGFQESILWFDVGTGGGRGLIANFDDPISTYVFQTGAFQDFVATVDEQFEIQGTIGPVIETGVVDVVLVAVVVGYFWLFVRTGSSPFGRVLKAIREDEDVARALGKDTRMFKIKSFMLGCAMMGLAGGLYAVYFLGSANPTAFRPQITFFVWVALIIGGAGSNTGSVIGAALFVGVLLQGPLYVRNVVTNLVEMGDAPNTIAGGFAGLLSLDPMPLFAYMFENMSMFRIIALGLVLIWLMKRRPDGLLGHRKETAASIPLRPVAAAGAPGSPAEPGRTTEPSAGADRETNPDGGTPDADEGGENA